jgi:hypothetical protein
MKGFRNAATNVGNSLGLMHKSSFTGTDMGYHVNNGMNSPTGVNSAKALYNSVTNSSKEIANALQKQEGGKKKAKKAKKAAKPKKAAVKPKKAAKKK